MVVGIVQHHVLFANIFKLLAVGLKMQEMSQNIAILQAAGVRLVIVILLLFVVFIIFLIFPIKKFILIFPIKKILIVDILPTTICR